MFLVAFVVAFAFIGCGSTTTEQTTAATTTGTVTTPPIVAAQQFPDGTTLSIYQNKVEIGAAMSTYAEAWGQAYNVEVTVQTCGGDSCAYGDSLTQQFQGSDQPDLFVIEGMGGYNTYSDYIAPLDGQDWIADTDLSFVVDGTVYGFPVAVEGWGMAYNQDILNAAGVQIATLTNLNAYSVAFQKIQDYYDANDMTDYSVVSMGAGSGLYWVTGLHNFNGYLSAGLDYSDTSVIDDLNNGIVDTARLSAYADWVKLLFDYSDPTVLTQGDYDAQVTLFASGHAAFIHQGNWIDPNLMTYFNDHPDSQFPMGYAPHAAAAGENTSIFVSAPSYYCLNVNASANSKAAAEQYLNDLASTPAGHDYMVNQAGMVAAFKSVTMLPSGPLSQALASWMASGNMYAWHQNDMPDGFGMNTLGPIYESFANGLTDEAQFIQAVTAAIEAIPTS